jgi:hypothetical protein
MHFKICRKASSSDDCERITGNPEVIGLSTGLVPRNAQVSTNRIIPGSYLGEDWCGYDRRKYLKVLCEEFEPCSRPLGPPTMRPDAPTANPGSSSRQLSLSSDGASSCKLKE